MLNHQQQQQQHQQQQQMEQLELQQLSYANQLQTLPGCNSTASSSSSPTCHSPSAGSGATVLTGNIALLSGGNSNGSDADITTANTAAAGTAASAAAAAAYHHHHQLTIIAPIVITPASMMNGDGALPLSTALQPIHASEAITTTTATALNGLDHNLAQRTVASSQHHTALLSHTALAYAPNAATATYLLSGSGGPTVLGGSGNSQGSIISNGISDHIMANGNPLCSFSEVTNTLLNQ